MENQSVWVCKKALIVSLNQTNDEDAFCTVCSVDISVAHGGTQDITTPPYSSLIIYADLPNFTVVRLASLWECVVFRLKKTSPTAYCDCWEKCKCRSLIAGNQAARYELLNRILTETDLVKLSNSRWNVDALHSVLAVS